MSKDLVCKVLNKWLVIKKISLKMCVIKANSKDFKFFECPIAPQIDSADDFGSMLIVSKPVIKLGHSLTNKFKIFECEDHLV